CRRMLSGKRNTMRNTRQSMKCMMIAALLGLMPGGTSEAIAKPLKVFILAGQSNMQGHVKVATFDSMADDPKTAPILKEMRNADGTPRVCEKVWISSVGCAGDGWKDVIEQKGKLTTGFGASTSEIGLEFTFGIYMEKALGELILIIKTSWENKMKVMAENFTPEEWKRLRAGASNGGYHYLGAAKIMVPIGKAFAEAMASFLKTQGYEI
ncbi:MAG: hypothetical protein NTW03_23500, partial [Verrucomicrobia bacterium]|nr:hypothetical protein [Verrucomicrobiota bacterium]